eukprot:4174846-Pleurochrysis_carterae.AAC.1
MLGGMGSGMGSGIGSIQGQHKQADGEDELMAGGGALFRELLSEQVCGAFGDDSHQMLPDEDAFSGDSGHVDGDDYEDDDDRSGAHGDRGREDAVGAGGGGGAGGDVGDAGVAYGDGDGGVTDARREGFGS